MNRRLLNLIAVWGLLVSGGSYARADDKDAALKGALIEALFLPILKARVAELDETLPTEIQYGLKGRSLGRNGLREEVDNHDIKRDGKKINETRYNFFDNYAWAEKSGTWGPPGFQYYVFRHPLTCSFDPKKQEFTLATKLEFKVAVAINYDTGFVGIKPWIFADTGFGDQWPNTLDFKIKSSITFEDGGKLRTNMTTHVHHDKPIVLQTLHGIVKRDCSPEVIQFLTQEMEKVARKFDADAQFQLNEGRK